MGRPLAAPGWHALASGGAVVKPAKFLLLLVGLVLVGGLLWVAWFFWLLSQAGH